MKQTENPGTEYMGVVLKSALPFHFLSHQILILAELLKTKTKKSPHRMVVGASMHKCTE